MKLPPLKIGELIAKIPVIQGGMGIGVSRANLASAVTNEGGIGVISGVQIGYDEPDFETNNKEANIRALKKQISIAKNKTNNGIIGLNLLTAMNNYDDLAKTAVESGIDLIISGAGLPISLPKIVEGTNCKAVPIVSSGKAASVICKLWDKKHNMAPDMLIVEGPKAGGHLGYSFSELEDYENIDFDSRILDVIKVSKEYEEKYHKQIPVVAAGGIYSGKDIAKYLKLGASGVQMATRFVATYECDASMKYKMAYVNSKEEDISIIKSPVGMPGRAIKNAFIDKLENGRVAVQRCYGCLKHCNPKDTPYCISKALIEAVKGNIEDGLIFVGDNAYKLNEILSVKDLMNELVREAELNY